MIEITRAGSLQLSLVRARSRLWGHVQLLRPPEASLVTLATLTGARLTTAGDVTPEALWVMAVSNTLLFAASMALNDACDAAEDAINKPNRPIPSGRVSRTEALVLASVLFALGIFLSGLILPRLGAAAAVVVLASFVYSLRLKRIPLAGNVLVALVTAYPLACWWLAFPSLSGLHLGVVLGVFLFRLGAEIVKTSEDFEGDRACGIRTVATAWSAGFANRLGATLLGLPLALGWGLAGIVRTGPAFVPLLGLSSLLIAASWLRIFFSPRPNDGRTLVVIERTVMVLMSLGLLLGLRP